MIAPVVDEIYRERKGFLKIAKVNVDSEPSLGARFNIRVTPMFFIFRNGEKISEMAGALPKPQFDAWIDSCINN